MKKIFSSIDKRLNSRALKSFSLIEERPSSPLPDIFENYSDLEGFYRLMKNTRVKSDSMIEEIGQENIHNFKGNYFPPLWVK